ncbi:hypothetical protein DUNSADRAFT_9334 [Dunaliella salina]|uniref:DNA polymerase delta subunit 3 n=1 Tax=Dunaliella salina TaxID=3046 RepID=A0ABQ7H5E6_DUNSA|nr:hypothetical protein DUNSADRAFT_9334 [Dunaliella salina]|eukprot:KAF5842075.1 hypothetical protein DUNSADRAFT_9334 [Dunaliella salina]
MADGEVDVPSIIEEVKGLLCQDLQVVSYKWLARQYQINANLAKRMLASIADSLKDKVATTYLVSGWTKDTKQHVVKVVQGHSYQDVCQQLESITSKHVYR